MEEQTAEVETEVEKTGVNSRNGKSWSYVWNANPRSY